MITPEWSHRIEAENIGPRTVGAKIAAPEQARKDVARRLKVESISKLEARFEMKRESGSLLIHVTGSVQADVTQLCIVSNKPIKTKVNEAFDAFYKDQEKAVSFARARHERMGRMMDAELQILEERDDPELAVDGKIDLGELAVQYLSLAVDPYPRAEGEEPGPEPEEPVTIGNAKKNPFAALKDWKAKQGREE